MVIDACIAPAPPRGSAPSPGRSASAFDVRRRDTPPCPAAHCRSTHTCSPRCPRPGTANATRRVKRVASGRRENQGVVDFLEVRRQLAAALHQTRKSIQWCGTAGTAPWADIHHRVRPATSHCAASPYRIGSELADHAAQPVPSARAQRHQRLMPLARPGHQHQQRVKLPDLALLALGMLRAKASVSMS